MLNPNPPCPDPSTLLDLPSEEARRRRREWNRGPLQDLFPRIPANSLEDVLDICIAKDFTYILSLPRLHNARRYSSIVVAHVRHNFSDYEALLRGTPGEAGIERFEARKRTAAAVWKVLREWCPWESSNEVLEASFRVTLLRPEEREPGWDPMDIDSDSEEEGDGGGSVGRLAEAEDPMDLD